MRRRARVLFAFACLASSAGAGAGWGRLARAETPPSIWDLAKDPAERARWQLHAHVERLLAAPSSGAGLTRMEDELRCEAAYAMLTDAGAERSPDLRLRYDLGAVYSRLATLQGRNDLLEKVVGVLQPALDAAAEARASGADRPDASDAATMPALETLVYAYAKLDRPREELATWRQYIPLLVDDRVRANAMMNMGEAEMRLGDAEGALATFREVLRMCGELPNTSGVQSTYVLALWDVAVALDRSGDPRGALDTAAKASRMDLGNHTTGATLITKDPKVFFVPEWERLWYLALGAAAEARDADDPREAAALWAAVERAWTQYVIQASAAAHVPVSPPKGATITAPGGASVQAAAPAAGATSASISPWLAVARVRLEQTRARRREADARAAKTPPPKTPAPKEPRWIGD